MINGYTDMGTPRFEEDLRLCTAWARRNGAPVEISSIPFKCNVKPRFVIRGRAEALLEQAGFRNLRLFYCGLWVCGWPARFLFTPAAQQHTPADVSAFGGATAEQIVIIHEGLAILVLLAPPLLTHAALLGTEKIWDFMQWKSE